MVTSKPCFSSMLSLYFVLPLQLLAVASQKTFLTPLDIILFDGNLYPKIELNDGWALSANTEGSNPNLAIRFTTTVLEDATFVLDTVANMETTQLSCNTPSAAIPINQLSRRPAPDTSLESFGVDEDTLFGNTAASSIYITRQSGSSEHTLGWNINIIAQVFVALRLRSVNGKDPPWYMVTVKAKKPFLVSCPRQLFGNDIEDAHIRVAASTKNVNIPETSWQLHIGPQPDFILNMDQKQLNHFMIQTSSTTLNATLIRMMNFSRTEKIPYPYVSRPETTIGKIQCDAVELSGPGSTQLAREIIRAHELFLNSFSYSFQKNSTLLRENSVTGALEYAPSVEVISVKEGYLLVMAPAVIGIMEVFTHGFPFKIMHCILLFVIFLYDVTAAIYLWGTRAKQQRQASTIQVFGVLAPVPNFTLEASVLVKTKSGNLKVRGLEKGDHVSVTRNDLMVLIPRQVTTDRRWAIIVSAGLAIEVGLMIYFVGRNLMKKEKEKVTSRRRDTLGAEISIDGFECSDSEEPRYSL